jgi:hypothetical protein
MHGPQQSSNGSKTTATHTTNSPDRMNGASITHPTKILQMSAIQSNAAKT